MMNMFVKFLGHLWGHWEWLMGLLLMIEPLIDYHVEGFRDWADKFIPRKTRTRIAVTVSGVTLLVACFLAFNDEYAEWQKDEELIHGKGGYEQQVATLNSRLSDTTGHLKDQGSAIEGHNGYKDQLS